MTAWLFALGGAAAGVLQAGSLARSARGVGSPLAVLPRLLAVGAVLALAARLGSLVPGALGWALGFGLASALVWRRLA